MLRSGESGGSSGQPGGGQVTREGETTARRRPPVTRPWQVALVAAVVAAALVFSWVGGGRPAAVSAGPSVPAGLGVNAAELSPDELGRALDLAESAGVTSIGAGAVWWHLGEGRARGSYDWAALDRLVSAAAARDLKVRLQLTGTPDWVHPRLQERVPELMDRIWYPPRTDAELADWADFVGAVVGRYGDRVAAYELWNEPNITDFWKPEPSPREYAALLRAGYLRAKEVDPQAVVVFGGLSHNDVGYLQEFYRQVREAYPGAADHHYFFDTLGVHPYTNGRSPTVTTDEAVRDGPFGKIDTNFSGLREMKAVMDANSDPGKGIYLGEYGFTTASGQYARPVSDRQRADYLKQAFATAGRLPYVKGMTWYAFLPTSSTAPGWAIMRRDWTPTATFQALWEINVRRLGS